MSTEIHSTGNGHFFLSMLSIKKRSLLKPAIFLIFCTLFFSVSVAQVGISSTSITPAPSSIFELRSTTLGFLPPRMTTTERDAIVSPATGLMIYNTTTSLLNFYNGSSWQIAGGSSANAVLNNQANSYTAGMKQTFLSSATTAGFNFGGVTANPSALSAGDHWYRSDLNKLFYRSSTTAEALVTEALAQTLTNKDLTSGTNTFPTFNQNTTGTASNITGILGASSFPALTGDVTTTAGSLVTAIAPNSVTVADMAPVATGTILGRNTAGTGNVEVLTDLPTNVTGKWTFLGTATANATTVGPVIWTGTYRQFMIHYLITGYNGATVGRMLFGAASISTTALTNGNTLSEGVTLTTNASVPGCPLAVTVSNLARDGWVMVDGASGAIKRFHITGQNGGTVAIPPTLFRATGVFSDLGTNLPLQRVQMTTYDLTTGTAVSLKTFSAGSYISVWGRNND